MTGIGIDSGSTVTKSAVVRDGAIVHTSSAPTGTDPAGSGSGLFENAKAACGLASVDGFKVCVTGYGRKLLGNLGGQKTEISCHALGAHALVTGALRAPLSAVSHQPSAGPAHESVGVSDAMSSATMGEDSRLKTQDSGLLSPASRLMPGFALLDIGGQDSKAIKVDADGRAADFAMNDKCAAGTGKFLEVISRTLGFGIEKISKAALGSSRKARLSSMCTVFADSEVVSLTARGERPDEIAWAACYAVAERCAGLVKRMGVSAGGVLVFTGGVSDLPAVAEALKEILGVEVLVPPLARFSGAIGAALFAAK